MRKIAFLVGNDTFSEDPSIPPLRFPQNDANELAEILGDKETCGFETIPYLNKTSLEILSDLDEISRELTQDDTLLFYYSGHGERKRVVPGLEGNADGAPQIDLDQGLGSSGLPTGEQHETAHFGSRLLSFRSDCKHL
jgi:hypothetical protein